MTGPAEPQSDTAAVSRVRDVSQPRPAGAARWLGGTLRLARAVLHQARWRPRFAAFGWRSELRAPALLTHPGRVWIGRGVKIRKGARIEAVGEGRDEVVRIGDGTSVHLYFHIGAALRVEIGRNVLIAGHVYVTDHDHELPEPGQARGFRRVLRAAPTVIEDDCWLGEGCKILKGVRLGQGCVVGANAVVTRSVPPYTAVGGVPARILRQWDDKRGAWVAPGVSEGSGS